MTVISNKTDTREGWKKGEPKRFIVGHSQRGRYGPLAGHWRGGTKMHSGGYIFKYSPDHPRSDSQGYVPEQYLIVEAIIGYILPLDSVIHHVNGNRQDNHHNNLVVCENNSYHRLLHTRIRALKECGNARYRKCGYCGEYDDLKNMYVAPGRESGWHKICQKERKANRAKN